MNLLAFLTNFLSELGWYILPLAFILSVVVFFHELGHYWVGRWCGVKIETFSLGFGPELFAWVDKRGTRWRLAALLLGGYVKFHGDVNVASAPDQEALGQMPLAERRQTLAGQPIINRAAIVAAGPIANFILAIVILTGLYAFDGRYVTTPRIGLVEAASPADLAGFRKGDLIKTVNGDAIDSFEELHQAIASSTGLEMVFGVDRSGSNLTITATPSIALVDMGPLGKRRIGRLGLGVSKEPADRRFETCSLPQCVAWSASDTWAIVQSTGAYITGLFAGRESTDQMSGLIGVGQIAGSVAKVSLLAVVNLAALFSVSVGLLNLLPIPLLDGGHLMFYAIEAVRGRPLSERAQEYGLRVGIALVAMLVIFTASHDILRLFAGGG
jgi:regulator of sigma E protease